jgi:RNA polymerase sigma-70 factor (ECF subfamily)
VYLIFNEGWAGRNELTSEALRLGQALTELMPDEPEACALLALMLLHDARRAGRTDADGRLVLLEDQDRTTWDQAMIEEGQAQLDRALRRQRPGPYQVQAAIAACHATASIAGDTDWHEIALLYGELVRMTGSPVVELNRAVAVAMADGPGAGLALADALSDRLDAYQYLHSARADLLRRLGRNDEAAVAYTRALELTTAAAERAFLERRLAEVTAG